MLPFLSSRNNCWAIAFRNDDALKRSFLNDRRIVLFKKRFNPLIGWFVFHSLLNIPVFVLVQLLEFVV